MRPSKVDPSDIHMPPDAAGVLAKDGARRASKHADREREGWTDAAAELVTKFVQELAPGAQFTAETVRNSRAGKLLDAPPDNRAWGAVMSRVAREGLIKSAGYTAGQDPRGHRHPVTLWEKCNA